MASSNQGGSILSFLVIGGVLAALFVGGAYLVQQRSKATQTPVAVQPATATTDQDEKKPASAPVADDKKAAVETKKEESQKEAPAAATPPATELPKTGPAETITSIIGVGLLSGAMVAYVRSRRAIVTL